MLALLVTLKSNEGRQKDLEAAFKWATDAVRANEPDNLLYQVVKSRDDETTYMIFELYKDQDALMVHRHSEHAKAMQTKVEGIFAQDPHLQYFDSI